MSKFFQATKAIDEAVINILTKFCWWTEIHFEKNNIWWSKVSLIFICPALDTMLDFFQKKEIIYTELFLSFLYLSLVMAIFVYTAFNYVDVAKTVFKNAQESPNKNQSAHYVDVVKIVILINFFLWWGTQLHKLFNASSGVNVVIFITFELAVYFLCTEPVPPALKRKKLEEKRLKNLQINLQTN